MPGRDVARAVSAVPSFRATVLAEAGASRQLKLVWIMAYGLEVSCADVL